MEACFNKVWCYKIEAAFRAPTSRAVSSYAPGVCLRLGFTCKRLPARQQLFCRKFYPTIFNTAQTFVPCQAAFRPSQAKLIFGLADGCHEPLQFFLHALDIVDNDLLIRFPSLGHVVAPSVGGAGQRRPPPFSYTG
jgi:hypothetical protein